MLIKDEFEWAVNTGENKTIGCTSCIIITVYEIIFNNLNMKLLRPKYPN
jgi:hypothetical protein